MQRRWKSSILKLYIYIWKDINEVGNTEETMWMNIKAHKNTARIDMRIDSEEMEEINDTIKI